MSFASYEDQTIPDLDSTLPIIAQNATYRVCNAESHDSIVSAVARVQIEGCIQWMRSELNHTSLLEM
ncbi:MAG: hypothetical protein KAR79_06170 [Simkaniaceae bacterium]|nr:hypothetical protein [Simkaniaceae bacterium]